MQRSRLALVALGALVATAMGLSTWWVVLDARRTMVRQVQASQTLLAGERSSAVTEAIAMRREQLELTAGPTALFAVEQGAVDQLADGIAALPAVLGVSITGPDGRLLAGRGTVPSTAADSGPVFRAPSDRTDLFVAISAPLVDPTGALVATIRQELSISRLVPQLGSTLGDVANAVSLVGRSGRVYYSTAHRSTPRIQSPKLAALIRAGRASTVSYHSDVLGTDRVAVVAPAGPGMMILVGVDASKAMSPATALALRMTGVLVAALAVVGVLLAAGILVVRRGRRRLEEARASAERLANTDALTGIGNRRSFEEAVARLGDRVEDAAVVMLDLDHLKPLNDTHGHAAGDLALQATAVAMRSAVRAGDHVARVGGDEFAVLIPAGGAERAEAVARRIRAAVAATDVGGAGPLSVSAGVGSAAGGSLEDALARADAALYEAKRARVPSVSVTVRR